MNVLRLGKAIRYFYEQFSEVRKCPTLWQADTVNGKDFCTYLYRVAPFSGTFGQRDLFPWEKAKVHQFSIPKIEYKAIRLFEREMKEIRELQLNRVDAITNDEVYTKDSATMNAYRKDKFVNFSDLNIDALSMVIDHITERLCDKKFTCDDFQEAIDALPKNTSAVYPTFHKKNSEQAIADARIKIAKLCSNLDAREKLSILNSQLVTVFHRFTMKFRKDKGKTKRDLKIRQVFGVPFCVTILESMLFGKALRYLAQPHIDSYFSYSLTRPQISKQVSNIKSVARETNSYILCGDYKSIDSSIPPFLIFTVFLFLSKFYNYNALQQQLFYIYNVWIIFTPVLWTNKQVDWMKGGNVTGSYATSFVNSFVTLVILSYAYYTLYGEFLSPEYVKILGDDFLLIIKDPEDKEKLISIMRSFGLTLNEKKSNLIYWDEDPNYLGFFWNSSYEPYQTKLWYLAKICFPERYVDVKGEERIIQRAAAILFQIKGGDRIFDKVFRSQIRWLDRLLEQGKDPLIQYLDRIGSQYGFCLPYTLLRRLGWKAF